MRILVTGADGRLGNCIRLAADKSENEYIFTDVDDLDITDPEAVRLGVGCNDFGLIVNCAAFTDINRAEKQEEIARLFNSTAVGYLAKAARDNDIPLIHISTDHVFGDARRNTPLRENDPVCPTDAYGRTKLGGEEAIVSSGCRYIIIRTSWLYSEFGKSIVKTMLRLTSSRQEAGIPLDMIGSPTYARDLADAIVEIIDSEKYDGHYGIYHYADEGVCSLFDLAKMTAEISGNNSCVLRPCRSDELPARTLRPSFSVLDTTVFRQTFGLEIPYWVDSLRKCIVNLLNPDHPQE